MPQSLAIILVHLVFSTKDRASLIPKELAPSLHAYLATVVRASGCECIRAGGTSDHVHLAIRLSRTESIARLVEELKTSSSRWAKSHGADSFAWQRGYGAFSVAPKSLEALRRYIDEQPEHHRTVTFQEEYRALLAEHGVNFDERYVWD